MESSLFKKIFPPLFTIILFIVSIFLIIHPIRWTLALSASLFLFLNLVIILGATYFGKKGLVFFGCLALLAVLFSSLRISEFAVSLIILLSTICIFYGYLFRITRFTHKINEALDNIEEEKNVLAVELKHARLEHTTLRQKLQRYTTLKSLTETLSSTLSYDELISLTTSETFRIIDKSNACLLYLVNKERQELNLVGTRLIDPHVEVRLKKGDIFDNRVLKQRTALLVEDTKKDFRFDVHNVEQEMRGVRSLISAPLISENKLLGILRLDNILQKVYDTDDLRLLDIISDLAAVAIENSLLYQQTQRLAITDGLSGLFVHRYFLERFDQEISRALWTDSQFAFLMIDIDGFKNYNDRYGHIAGDIVLRKIAKSITSNVRPGDIVARYGGEEFAVLLVDTPKKEALKIAERIRENIEKKKFILRRQATQVKVSGGISFFPEGSKVKEGLIEKADQALYKAKAQGKNRICRS